MNKKQNQLKCYKINTWKAVVKSPLIYLFFNILILLFINIPINHGNLFWFRFNDFVIMTENNLND